MKRKTLIPVNEEELKRHDIIVEEISQVLPIQSQPQALEGEKNITEKNAEDAIQVPKNTPSVEKNDEVTIEFKPSLRTKVNKINVIISGKLNIYNIDFIKTKILEKCETYSNVEILLKNIYDFDITFIQFSYYFMEEKKTQSHIVTFDIEKPNNQISSMLSINNYSDLFIRKKLA